MFQRLELRPVAIAFLVLLCTAACGEKPAGEPAAQTGDAAGPAAAAAAPPPPPPETSLGTLRTVERADKAPLHALCSGSGRAFLGVVSWSGKGEPPAEMIRNEEIGNGKSVYHGSPGLEVMNSDLGQTGLELCEREGAARTGSRYVILRFEGKQARSLNQAGEMSDFMLFEPRSASDTVARVEGRSWITDASGGKYEKPAVVAKEGSATLAFELPADAAGLVWHDGEKSYQLEPHPAEVTATAAP
jgi:hypothetical protein